jgi:hypothetical protein
LLSFASRKGATVGNIPSSPIPQESKRKQKKAKESKRKQKNPNFSINFAYNFYSLYMNK